MKSIVYDGLASLANLEEHKMANTLPNSFHVVMTNGSERDVKGTDFKVTEGSLVIRGVAKQDVVAYAPGVWAMIEVERKDDK